MICSSERQCNPGISDINKRNCGSNRFNTRNKERFNECREAIGFFHVLQIIWAQRWGCVWFEGDNVELTTLFNKRGESIEIENVLYDIWWLTSKLSHCSLDMLIENEIKQQIFCQRKSMNLIRCI